MIAEFDAPRNMAWTQLWQVTIVIGAAAIITRVCCRHRPHLAYLLWLLVFVKCWIPPVWSSPSGLFSWAGGEATGALDLAPASRSRTAFQHDRVRQAAAVRITPAQNRIDRQPQSQVVSPARPRRATAGMPDSRGSLWPRAALGIWLAGVAFLSTAAYIRFSAWRRRLSKTVVAPEPSLAALVADLAARLGIRRNVQVLVSSAAGPAVFGVARPALVLPEVLVRSLDRQRLAAIVAHELVHVRRGDLLVGWLQLATQFAWWFHPLVWWSGVQLARERERCCDEEALSGLGCNPADYAQTLLDVMKLRRWLRPLVSCPGIRAAEVTSRRLEHIVRFGAQAHPRTPRTYWLIVAVLFCLFAPGAAFRARSLAAQPSNAISASGPTTHATDRRIAADDREKKNAEEVSQSDPAADRKKSVEPRSQAVERAIAFLQEKQRADGSWSDPVGYEGGITALCTLALLRSGVAADEPSIKRALDYLHELPPAMIYSTALTTLAFCEADRDVDRSRIKRNVAWFGKVQMTNGPRRGAWGYPQGSGDNSNTGFAVMALYGADRAGVHVDDGVWRRVLEYSTSTQNADGSWGYQPGIPGTGSMTCEGVFCVAAAARVLDDAEASEAAQQALSKAEQWLAKSFSPATNPGTRGRQVWQFYYLFAASEAGRMAKLKTFGNHDWNQEGAEELLRQQKPDGSWIGQGHAEDNPSVATSFALLFLRQGERRAQ